jgi:four helix bundle protein
MSEQSEALKQRTFAFSVAVCRTLKLLPRAEPGPTVARQLAKSSTATAANYRAACRGRSHAEFTAKLGVAAEECDETQFWLEFMDASALVSPTVVAPLRAECEELIRILSRSVGTARMNERQSRG